MTKPVPPSFIQRGGCLGLGVPAIDAGGAARLCDDTDDASAATAAGFGGGRRRGRRPSTPATPPPARLHAPDSHPRIQDTTPCAGIAHAYTPRHAIAPARASSAAA